MKEISLSEMLKCGMHFGHRKSKRHPKMSPYIFANKQHISIIDLEKTKEKLEEALKIVADLAKADKKILFIGTKRQAKDIVKKYAEECEMPYIVENWIGGLFTNFNNVSRLSKKLTRLKKQRDTGELDKYTKKEKLNFLREIKKLEKLVGGIEGMVKIPEAVFIVDLKKEKTAVRETIKVKVPVIAMVDTNVNPDLANYPIPTNDEAIKSIEYVTKLMAETIKENKGAAPEVTATKTKEVKPVAEKVEKK